MRPYDVIIYGSYGYTGPLITKECVSHGLRVLLSGRNHEKLSSQSAKTGLPFEVVGVSETQRLIDLLNKGYVVIHCGGPFQFTARYMVDACLKAQTHYTDITGEYQVFEELATYDEKARKHGIFLMPGVGFDVVPSDCLAMHLKTKLPTATHLQLAFAMSKGGLSRGTSKTMIEGLGFGGMVREAGKLTKISLGARVKTIDFGSFTSKTICIPWGDIATAYRSTGIPNIEVYSAVPEKAIRMARMSRWFNGLLRQRWLKNFLLRKVDAKPPGPTTERLEAGRSYLWGEAWDEHGQSIEARLETLSGYKLTAKTAALIAVRLLASPPTPGYFTPAQYFGSGLILEVESSQLT